MECETCASTTELMKVPHPDGHVEIRCESCNEDMYMAQQEGLMSGPTYRERISFELEQAKKLK